MTIQRAGRSTRFAKWRKTESMQGNMAENDAIAARLALNDKNQPLETTAALPKSMPAGRGMLQFLFLDVARLERLAQDIAERCP